MRLEDLEHPIDLQFFQISRSRLPSESSAVKGGDGVVISAAQQGTVVSRSTVRKGALEAIPECEDDGRERKGLFAIAWLGVATVFFRPEYCRLPGAFGSWRRAAIHETQVLVL